MIIALLFTLTALASPPLWRSAPLTDVAGIKAISDSPSGQRATLAGGGIIRVHIADSVPAAEAAFAGERRTAATTWPHEPPAGLPGDQNAGDGEQMLLIRDRNAVIFVRDLGGDATAVTESIQRRLVD